MNKLNKILAGIDFSDRSRSALEQAVRLAKWNNARLHALHSIEYLTLSDAAWASHIPQEELDLRIIHAMSPASFNSTDQELQQTLDQLHGLKYVLLGSTAERLLKEIPCSGSWHDRLSQRCAEQMQSPRHRRAIEPLLIV
jgi:nucleotide-binding universal stress UspA family protein